MITPELERFVDQLREREHDWDGFAALAVSPMDLAGLSAMGLLVAGSDDRLYVCGRPVTCRVGPPQILSVTDVAMADRPAVLH